MTDNFLPEFQLAETQGAGRNKLRCQVRGYDVPATPEEQVRQRVLHWLINTKSWEKSASGAGAGVSVGERPESVTHPTRHRAAGRGGERLGCRGVQT